MTDHKDVLVGLLHALTLCDNLGDVTDDVIQALKVLSPSAQDSAGN
jgi:hypothetical protein